MLRDSDWTYRMGAQEESNGNVAARNKSAMTDEITVSDTDCTSPELNWS